MNWRLVFRLSLFGLAMAIATVYWISSAIEPFFWLVIFGISAYLIATRAATRLILHGVVLGLANSVWVTGAHLLLLDAYLANHAREAAMMSSAPLPPRVMMLLVGPVIGLASGLVIGLLSLAAARFTSSPTQPSESASYTYADDSP